MTKEMGEWLSHHRKSLSEKEGHPWDKPLTWQELSTRSGIPVNNLLRWGKGIGTISDQYVATLAELFQDDEIYLILGYLPPNIDSDLEWLILHRNKPEVIEVIRRAKSKAAELLS